MGVTALFSPDFLRRCRARVRRRRRRFLARVAAVIAMPAEAFAEQAGVPRVDDGDMDGRERRR